MKPAKFEFEQPSTVAEAVDALVRYDGEAKVMAGGQSLVPLLSMRLSQPDAIVDLTRIPELRGIGSDGRVLTIGAMATHRAVETSGIVADAAPMLPLALAQVGHVTIRNQGTVGGSIAHADPAAELPAAALALDAVLRVHGPSGVRDIPAADFFLGFLTTALEPEDVLVEIRIPVAEPSMGWSVVEFSRRHGDFAVVAAFAGLGLAADGTIGTARLALAGVASTPVRVAVAEQDLVGARPDNALFDAVAARTAAGIDPSDDIHGSAEYRRDVCRTVVAQALAESLSRCAATTTRT